jgi:hypothetical protein
MTTLGLISQLLYIRGVLFWQLLRHPFFHLENVSPILFYFWSVFFFQENLRFEILLPALLEILKEWRQYGFYFRHNILSNENDKILNNRTTHFSKYKQLFEYQHLLLLWDIWWSEFQSIFKCSSFFQHRC